MVECLCAVRVFKQPITKLNSQERHVKNRSFKHKQMQRVSRRNKCKMMINDI